MKSFDIVYEEFEPYILGTKDIKQSVPTFHEDVISDLILTSVQFLASSDTVLKVPTPSIVIGDIHGNIEDLVQIFNRFHDFTKYHFLFLGDYVDRGIHSVEVMALLLALLCKFPRNFFLIRGNHEFLHINKMYGFYDEIMYTYSKNDLWYDFQDAFAYLPLAAIVNNSIFCVHGGLSPLLDSVEIINEVRRPIDSYENDPLISDLVWSDPYEQVDQYAENSRGSGVIFGFGALQTFLKKNNFKLMIRAHQCMADGYSTFFANTGITVFSSSEYCRLMHNKCGVLKIFSSGKIEIYSYSADSFNSTEPKVTMMLNLEGTGMKRHFNKKTSLPPVLSTKNYTVRTPKRASPSKTISKPMKSAKKTLSNTSQVSNIPPNILIVNSQNNPSSANLLNTVCSKTTPTKKLPILGRSP